MHREIPDVSFLDRDLCGASARMQPAGQTGRQGAVVNKSTGEVTDGEDLAAAAAAAAVAAAAAAATAAAWRRR